MGILRVLYNFNQITKGLQKAYFSNSYYLKSQLLKLFKVAVDNFGKRAIKLTLAVA